MAFKSISTVLTQEHSAPPCLDMAIALAQTRDAHLDVFCLGLDRTQPGFYYAGSSAMISQDNFKKAQQLSQAIEAGVQDRLTGAAFSWSAFPMAVQASGLTPFLAHHVRFSDLVVLPRPYGKGHGYEEEEILEAVLFNGQMPVLVVPEGSTVSGSFDRVVIAWNESAEALRAVRAAMPFLRQAKSVDVTIIDPRLHGPDRSDPGGALSLMLARQGVRAEVSVLAKTMPRVSDVLRRHLSDKSADLLVMGAYGHSRFRESILGGATRNMLEQVEIPTLMAH
ncbi:universal stress protein [Candidatus Halocynthiibacter alkanivorans]|uniref:universal stress protein n=1 Tax=Candidatus Halocynthiibacter alkanivorans TaxID=2267619 RepID=UPI000DF26338|nr:universal stress protein [Candidatus Halocynthiibacter alkanivorans]